MTRLEMGIGLVVALVVIGLLGWYEWNIWQECLGKNSWFFCFRVLV